MALETIDKPTPKIETPISAIPSPEKSKDIMPPLSEQEKKELSSISYQELTNYLIKNEGITNAFDAEKRNMNDDILSAGGKITVEGFKEFHQEQKNAEKGTFGYNDNAELVQKERAILAHKIKELRKESRRIRDLENTIESKREILGKLYDELNEIDKWEETSTKQISDLYKARSNLKGGLGLKNLLNRSKINEITRKIDEMHNTSKINIFKKSELKKQINKNSKGSQEAILRELKDKYGSREDLLATQKEMISDFYQEAATNYQNKEREKIYQINSRPLGYNELVAEKPVFLLHGITEGNVGGNSAIDQNLEEGRGDIKFKTLMLGPTVSTFTFEEGQQGGGQFWGNNFVVYGKDAIITDGSKKDYHTISTGFRSRVPRDDMQGKKFNYETVKDRAVEAVADFNRELHNELITQGTPVGFVLNLGSPGSGGYESISDSDFKEAFKRIDLAKEQGLDIYAIKDGQMFEVTAIRDIETIKKLIGYGLPLESKPNDIRVADLLTLGKKVTPEDLTEKESPLTKETQAEIAKELIHKKAMGSEYYDDIKKEFIEEGDKDFENIEKEYNLDVIYEKVNYINSSLNTIDPNKTILEQREEIIQGQIKERSEDSSDKERVERNIRHYTNRELNVLQEIQDTYPNDFANIVDDLKKFIQASKNAQSRDYYEVRESGLNNKDAVVKDPTFDKLGSYTQIKTIFSKYL